MSSSFSLQGENSKFAPKKAKHYVPLSRPSSFYLLQGGATANTVPETAKRNVFISSSSSFHFQSINPEVIPAKAVHFDDHPLSTDNNDSCGQEIGELHECICVSKEFIQITFHKRNHKLNEATIDSSLMNPRGSPFYRRQRIPILPEIASKENHLYLPMHKHETINMNLNSQDSCSHSFWNCSNSERRQPLQLPRISNVLRKSPLKENLQKNVIVKPMQTIQGGFNSISAVSNNTARLVTVLVHKSHPSGTKVQEKKPVGSIEIIIKPVKLGKDICISVKQSEGMYPLIYINENATVYELMEQISDIRGPSTLRQKLIFNHKLLEEAKLLSQYNIEMGSCLYERPISAYEQSLGTSVDKDWSNTSMNAYPEGIWDDENSITFNIQLTDASKYKTTINHDPAAEIDKCNVPPTRLGNVGHKKFGNLNAVDELDFRDLSLKPSRCQHLTDAMEKMDSSRHSIARNFAIGRRRIRSNQSRVIRTADHLGKRKRN